MSSELKLQLDELRQEKENLGPNPDKQDIQDLEERAQELLNSTQRTMLNEDAIALLREISKLDRQTAAPPSPPLSPSVDTERLLRGARVRIRTAGTPTDLRDALDKLRQVLDAEPENDKAYSHLEELVEKNEDFEGDVEKLLVKFEDRAYRAAEALKQIRKPDSDSEVSPLFTRDKSPPSGVVSGTDSSTSLEIEELISRLEDQYYLGEYRESIELCHKIQLLDPENSIAKDYLHKAEARLEEGYVPETKIPARARMAYNKGLSAKRAGMYREAQNLFNEAQRIAESEGIDRWGDIERALIDIEDLVLAKRLENEADELAKQDKWEEALPKYEGALELKGFPRTEKKYGALKKVIRTYRETGVRLSTLSGSLTDIARQLSEMRNELSEARAYWAESIKLGELWAQVDARSRETGVRLQERGENLLDQARSARTINDRLRFTDEALRYLETGRDLLSDDPRIDTLLLQAITEEERAQNIKDLLEDTERLLSQRDASGIDEALTKLQTVADEFSDYIKDPRYRSLLAKLQRYLLEQVEGELDSSKPNLSYARTQLEKVRSNLFRPLGRVPEIRHLEERIEKRQRALRMRQFRPYILAAGAGVAILILIFATRGAWEPIVNPPPTPTFTVTPTFTPTNTPTITPTPTNTSTPTPTSIPSPTPQTELCLGVTKSGSRYYVYPNPDRDSSYLGTVAPQVRVRILDQTRDKGGALWYKIDYGDEDTQQIGWIPAQFVIEVTDCPRLP
jgi:hypothetical protein